MECSWLSGEEGWRSYLADLCKPLSDRDLRRSRFKIGPILNLDVHCDLPFGRWARFASNIATCQREGMEVLLSLNGGVSGYLFDSADEAREMAQHIWDNFMRGSDDNIINLEIESGEASSYMDLRRRLREVAHNNNQRQMHMTASSHISVHVSWRIFGSAAGHGFWHKLGGLRVWCNFTTILAWFPTSRKWYGECIKGLATSLSHHVLTLFSSGRQGTNGWKTADYLDPKRRAIALGIMQILRSARTTYVTAWQVVFFEPILNGQRVHWARIFYDLVWVNASSRWAGLLVNHLTPFLVHSHQGMGLLIREEARKALDLSSAIIQDFSTSTRRNSEKISNRQLTACTNTHKPVTSQVNSDTICLT